MTSKVLVLGFDACEITLVERWIADGLLPQFGQLFARSRSFRLRNPMETLPGAIWPEINTGISSGRMGDFYIPNQLRTGEARLRATRPEDIDPGNYYWTQASRAGCRVAVIDPVQAVHAPGLNGIQLYEWGLHDRTFCVSSDPPGLIAEIRGRFGDHPVTSCDLHGETTEGYRRLRDGLLCGIEAKSTFLPDLLDREAWDLFACTFSESHCAGHQFWHFLDRRHPWHDAHAPADLRDALLAVYRGIDAGVGKVLDSAGDGATVLAVFSHGMDLYYDGPQLLPEVLVRLGMASGELGRAGSWLRKVKTRVTHLPRPVKKLIKRFARADPVQGMVAAAGCLVDPFESSRTRAAFVSNNRCGAIRLNLRGREPHGCVEPGDEAASLIAMLKRELMALRDPVSNETIVARVVTAGEQFGPGHHPDLPDLICVFRTDLGMHERCVSPAIGEVHAPVYHPHAPRTGDHTVNSRLWASGPGVRAHAAIGDANVLDIAPTVLDLLGVPLPAWLSGHPLPLRERRASPPAGLHARAGISQA
jgi:predicted AlkP superfamily phosphohydrolase/phosphomutase